jgi:hypothetical protein
MTSSYQTDVEAFLCLWERLSRLLYWRGRELRQQKSDSLSEVYTELLRCVRSRAKCVSEFIADQIRYIEPLLSVEEDYFEDHCFYLIEEVENKIRLIYQNINGNRHVLSRNELTLLRRADRFLLRRPKRLRSVSAHSSIPFRYAIQHNGKAPTTPEFQIIGWDLVTSKDVRRFSDVLRRAKSEREMQNYLERHPSVLIQHLGGGHGRWVIPQQRLGSQFVTDFMIGERSSLGIQWYPIELESPVAKIFKKNGDPSSTLTHALRQIQDWRVWLQDNIDYARRPKGENGLGLIDVEPQSMGYIIIGRSTQQTESYNRRRRHMIHQMGIQTRTFDWLLDNLHAKALSLSTRN